MTELRFNIHDRLYTIQQSDVLLASEKIALVQDFVRIPQWFSWQTLTMEITYTKYGDYYLPDSALPVEDSAT